MVYISYASDGIETWKITASDDGITGVHPSEQDQPVRDNSFTAITREELMLYFAGECVKFSAPLALRGTAFQQQVWRVLREIPYGETVSYSCVAQMAGRPDAVRAAAQAIGHNPCLILVPCHRVLGKNGSLTGYAAGLERKARLLTLEGASYYLPYKNRSKPVKSGQKIG